MKIVEDTRIILAIETPTDEGRRWTIGKGEITKIEPYDELGQMAYVTWFKVYKGDKVVFRVNGAFVEYITY